jgi:hypothetical protein
MPKHNPFFEVTPAYFAGNPNRGRTTKVLHKSTGVQMEFMGALNKGEAINQFEKQLVKHLLDVE